MIKYINKHTQLMFGVTFVRENGLVVTPLGARLGLGTQTPYEVPGDFWVEIAKTQ